MDKEIDQMRSFKINIRPGNTLVNNNRNNAKKTETYLTNSPGERCLYPTEAYLDSKLLNRKATVSNSLAMQNVRANAPAILPL